MHVAALRSQPLAALLAAASLLALAACASAEEPTASSSPPQPSSSSAAPTPSPLPTRPALAELELSVDGLGPLTLGAPPAEDPATRMVAFDPEGCVSEEFGIAPSDPGAGLWRTDDAYTATDPTYGPGSAFGVAVSDDGAVYRIDVYSPDIPTDGGVRIGDDGARVASAHPDATVVADYLTDIYVVSGANGLLQIEVAKNDPELGDYWGPLVGSVVYLRSVLTDVGVFSVAASGNLVGVCVP